MDSSHAAAAAVAATCARTWTAQVLADARSDDPEVVAVVIEARHSTNGTEVDFEYRNREGMAVGGGSL